MLHTSGDRLKQTESHIVGEERKTGVSPDHTSASAQTHRWEGDLTQNPLTGSADVQVGE